MVASLGVVCFGSVQHALGVASLTTGHVDRAIEHLRAAVHRNLATAHWPAVMTSRLRYAQALTLRGQPHDVTTARNELATAAEEARAMGIATLSDGKRDVAAVCTRQGRRWRIELGRRSTVVEHSIGMLHLAVLIANPGYEIPAVDLAIGVAVLGNAAAAGESPQPILDQVAKREYRHRLSRLRVEIDDFEARDESERAGRARAEEEWLMAEIAGATGIGGRTRRFPDNAERARLAVGKAIRRALTRIEQADALIGAHLRSSVHTGVRCSYRPS
jgi:hypothetical protein